MTVLLDANANGDLKFKPMVVYHCANPRASKGYLKSTVGIYFRSSKREELPRIKEHCVDLAKQVRFEEVEIEDVEELLESHCEDHSTIDPQQLVTEGEVEAGDEENEVQDA
eukprot:g32035.t1